MLQVEEIDSKERDRIESELKLASPTIIEEALKYWTNNYRNEEIRRDKSESRATILIATSGIMIAFVTGFLCMILNDAISISLLLVIFVIAIYIIIAISISKSISYSLISSKLKLITLNDRHFMDYNIKESDIMRIKRSRVLNYFLLYIQNKEINDEKENYINLAQHGIKNAVMVLILLGLSFVIDLVLSSKINIKSLNIIREFIQ